jgi:zinc protease
MLLLSASPFAQHPRDMKFPPIKFEPPEPVRFETNNGMIVYFLEDHQLPVLTLSAYFRGGRVQDLPGRTGLADITATLLRSGGAGQRFPEQIDADLDFVGISLNSGSEDEYFSLSMNLLAKNIDLGFEILSDILLKPSFDSTKLNMELSNSMDEIRRQNDDPRDISRRVYNQTIYGDHSYAAYPTLASTENIKRDDIIACHKKYYNPNNCILAISGDKSLAEIKVIIAKYFDNWNKTDIDIKIPPMAEAKFKPGVYYAEKDINQANIRFGHLCMTDKNPDRYAMEVMNFALGGGGFSSRLMRQVRTANGLAYSVGTFLYNRPYMGSLFGYCQTKAEQLSSALQMMLDIIADVKANGITAEEMELAKESIINGYVFSYDTPAGLVNAIATLELRGFPADQLQKDLEAYQAVTLEKCNEVAQKYLDTKNIAIIIVGNDKLFDKPLDTFGPVTRVSMEIQ